MLRAVEHEGKPLDDAAMQERGNQLASEIRQAAIEAVRQSMHAEFLERARPLTAGDIRRWRHRARTALEAWQTVDNLTSELLTELKRHEEAHYRHELREQPGKPGHYEYVRVPRDDNDPKGDRP